MLPAIDQTRLRVSARTDPQKKSRLGQFMTPGRTAQFMAQLFPASTLSTCRLLDPGAGIGSLSAAFLERWDTDGFGFDAVHLTACEIDETLHHELKDSLSEFATIPSVSVNVVTGDFIEYAVNRIQFHSGGRFTHSILNPPYKKIGSRSRHRLLLSQVGIETVNLYSAFVALVLHLMDPGGHLVAIIPRSFCNGPYYRPFREFFLERAALHHIHLFGSRTKAFKDDGVLQENVIIMLERGGKQGNVTITTSTDDGFSDVATHVHPFNRIVLPGDQERFIHVPTSLEYTAIESSRLIRCSLDDIGVQISTGPVVDFRLREHIRNMPEPGTVPLLYPGHFDGQEIKWPKEGMKKPNAIRRNAATEKWLYPAGCYCVVRRFSSKEEKRRIVASMVRPGSLSGAEMLGFENHLNVFHDRKRGLPEALARGLTAYLNTSAVDDHFRRFNGHTQVNAADLRLMKYPDRETLTALGKWAKLRGPLTQAVIDERLGTLAA